MANQVTNYKCPACTGPLRFDSATGKLQCDFCGSSYEVAEIEKLYAEKDAQAAGAFRQAEEQAAADGEWTSASGSDWGADAEKLRVYSCPSCGAELICDETTSATSCPYCGNNTIVPGQFSGALKPDYVLPFKLDKAAAVAALKKHYGGKKLLPKAFSNENHIEEVKGVYVPFWLYDGSAEVDVRCHGTKVSGYSTARENVTVTNHYDVRRAGAVLGCASLGATYGNDALDLHALLEDNGYAARYPFLLDLPSKLAVSTGGWEIYCIVPADEDVSITVNEFGWPSWDAEGPVAGEVLWESGSGTPLCIAANVSDIMPDTQITVTAADGTAIIYQPFLSLRDGSLAVPEDGTVYDFTVYPEGFVRETTA